MTYGHHCAYCAGTWYPSRAERNCPGCGAPPAFSARDKQHLMGRGRWPVGDAVLEGNQQLFEVSSLYGFTVLREPIPTEIIG